MQGTALDVGLWCQSADSLPRLPLCWPGVPRSSPSQPLRLLLTQPSWPCRILQDLCPPPWLPPASPLTRAQCRVRGSEALAGHTARNSGSLPTAEGPHDEDVSSVLAVTPVLQQAHTFCGPSSSGPLPGSWLTPCLSRLPHPGGRLHLASVCAQQRAGTEATLQLAGCLSHLLLGVVALPSAASRVFYVPSVTVAPSLCTGTHLTLTWPRFPKLPIRMYPRPPSFQPVAYLSCLWI